MERTKGWQLSTFALLAAAGLAALGSAVLTVAYGYLYYRLDFRGGAVTFPHVYPVLGAYVLVLVALAAAQVWWSLSIRRLLPDRRATRHWARTACLVLVALSLCCGLSQGYANPDPAGYDRAQWLATVETSAVSMAMRTVALALLLFGTWAAAQRARTEMARPGGAQ